MMTARRKTTKTTAAETVLWVLSEIEQGGSCTHRELAVHAHFSGRSNCRQGILLDPMTDRRKIADA